MSRNFRLRGYIFFSLLFGVGFIIIGIVKVTQLDEVDRVFGVDPLYYLILATGLFFLLSIPWGIRAIHRRHDMDEMLDEYRKTKKLPRS